MKASKVACGWIRVGYTAQTLYSHGPTLNYGLDNSVTVSAKDASHTEQGAPELCYHCLEPIPKYCTINTVIDGVSRPMCCIGCKAAADFISQRSLNRFYEHRDRVDAKDFFGSLNSQEAASNLSDEWLFLDQVDGQRYSEYVQSGSGGIRTISMMVHGLYCSSCAWLVEKAVHSISRDTRVHVEVDALKVTIQVSDPAVLLSEIPRTIARLGYRPELISSKAWFDLDNTHKLERSAALRRLLVAGFCMMQVMTYAVGFYMADASEQGMLPTYERFFLLVSMLVATVAVFYSGKPFFTNALNDLRNGHFGMDVPVALAVGGAYFPSVYVVLSDAQASLGNEVYFDSAVMFVFFLSIGRYVEMRARHRLADSSGEVNRMLPKSIEVTRANNGNPEQHAISPNDVVLADQITLKAGQVVPFDARILEGEAAFDESLLSGESLAVNRGEGDQVFVGSRLLTGEVKLTAIKEWTDSSLFKINQLVQKASANVGETAFSQVGRSFVLWVLILTALVAGIWYVIEPERVFQIVLAMLVASCPCAFSLAAPVGRTAAAHTLRRNGILLANAHALSSATQIDTWLFDKTGTLTLGKPSIEHVLVFDELDQHACLTMIADVESHSEHALAAAFTSFRSELGAENLLEQFTDTPGFGVHAIYAGKPIWIGKRAWVLNNVSNQAAVDSRKQDIEQLRTISPTASEVWVAYDNKLVCMVLLNDSLRASARTMLANLKVRGADIQVLSGDKHSAVAGACSVLGIDSYRAELLPDQKLSSLQKLQAEGHHVAMVGDGVNDAPVLAAADLSVALATGSELSKYHADIILLNGDLDQIGRLLDVAKLTGRVTRQNLNWALAYNAIALPLAAFGYLNPWLAALGMSFSSLLVVLNALRIRSSSFGRSPKA